MALLVSTGHLLLCIVAPLALLVFAPQPSCASKGPKQVEFYMRIAVQDNGHLDSPIRTPVNAVQTAKPLSVQPYSFGIIHTFDTVLTSAADLTSTQLGRAQGWYGDVGQDVLTLSLVVTFTWDDGKHNGTFSVLGVDIADAADKSVPVVGGTGDFAYALGVAQISLHNLTDINFETVSWFRYVVKFKY